MLFLSNKHFKNNLCGENFCFHFKKQSSICTIPRFSTVFKVSSTPVSPFANITIIAKPSFHSSWYFFLLCGRQKLQGVWDWSQFQLQQNAQWPWSSIFSIFLPKYNFYMYNKYLGSCPVLSGFLFWLTGGSPQIWHRAHPLPSHSGQTTPQIGSSGLILASRTSAPFPFRTDNTSNRQCRVKYTVQDLHKF